jgi:hypothetical protein
MGIADLKKEANRPKSDLIQLLNQIESVSPGEARKLEAIIIRLEKWQQSQRRK